MAWTTTIEHDLVSWSMPEAGADLAGYFDTLEAMVRAKGMSPTASWLLFTLFCDVFGMDRSVYISFAGGPWLSFWRRGLWYHQPVEGTIISFSLQHADFATLLYCLREHETVVEDDSSLSGTTVNCPYHVHNLAINVEQGS